MPKTDQDPELVSSAIEKGSHRIIPDILVAGSGTAADGMMGMLTKLLPEVGVSALLKKPEP